MHDQMGFENFRRERNKRRFEEGPLRPLGQNAAVLREIEEADAREARNQRLTREVHEFFAEATRTAATIVSQVAENAEQELQDAVANEMSEFLSETIRRAQMFVELMRAVEDGGVSQAELQANMQNLVGPALDEFRFAGDASTAETHLGQDPFATSVSPAVASVAPDAGDAGSSPDAGSVGTPTPVEPASPIEEHLVAEVIADTDDAPAPDSDDPLRAWFDRLRGDGESLQNALKLLVRSDAMTKEEARAIYRVR